MTEAEYILATDLRTLRHVQDTLYHLQPKGPTGKAREELIARVASLILSLSKKVEKRMETP